jgi:hypothetical protein
VASNINIHVDGGNGNVIFSKGTFTFSSVTSEKATPVQKPPSLQKPPSGQKAKPVQKSPSPLLSPKFGVTPIPIKRKRGRPKREPSDDTQVLCDGCDKDFLFR